MAYPSKWQSFCRWHRANGVENLPQHVDFAELNRFAARYRLAKSFRGVAVEGYADATAEAYGAVMQAFLAHSTLEQLHKAIKDESEQHLNSRWASMATEPSAQLRRAKSILLFLQENMDKPFLRNRLQDFIEGKTDNSLYVASALRNAVAHGFMSVHPKGTSPRTAVLFCERISEMLMQIADEEFTTLVDSLAQTA